MKAVIASIISWACIAIILAADAEHPLALRLQGAVSVIVVLLNGLAILSLLCMAMKDARATMRQQWRAAGPLVCLYRWMMGLLWLAALAWAGWLWTFGIRLVWLLAWSFVVTHQEDGRQENNAT